MNKPVENNPTLKDNIENAVDYQTRIEILDMLRGICVVIMVIYHGLYIMSQYFTFGRELIRQNV